MVNLNVQPARTVQLQFKIRTLEIRLRDGCFLDALRRRLEVLPEKQLRPMVLRHIQTKRGPVSPSVLPFRASWALLAKNVEDQEQRYQEFHEVRHRRRFQSTWEYIAIGRRTATSGPGTAPGY